MQSQESEYQQVIPEQGSESIQATLDRSRSSMCVGAWTGWPTGLTGGNLTLPLRKLEEAGYIATTKEFVDTKSRMWVEATREGLRAYSDYPANLEHTLNMSPR